MVIGGLQQDTLKVVQKALNIVDRVPVDNVPCNALDRLGSVFSELAARKREQEYVATTVSRDVVRELDKVLDDAEKMDALPREIQDSLRNAHRLSQLYLDEH